VAKTSPSVTVTPAGNYTITLTPLATASGSNKQLQLNPIALQLTVK
jgi:PKD repeat protein